MRLVCALGLFLALLHLSSSLLLGAFNIRSFGRTKAGKPHVMDIISTIVQRYDIVLIQEVRDTDLSATTTLMNLINGGATQYSYIVSDPLGPSTYKERYLFIYRTQMVTVTKSYTYDDGCESCGTDTFSREPFIVMFSSPNTAVKDFVLIPQHTSPEHAVKQIDLLYDVVTDVINRWNTNNIVLLGDFNAGCTYVKDSDWLNIRLFTDRTINGQSFHWLIGNQVDTTVSGSNCPYDRIVVTAAMLPGVVPNSAVVYNFRTALSPETRVPPVQSSDVSDHFPVEVQLR